MLLIRCQDLLFGPDLSVTEGVLTRVKTYALRESTETRPVKAGDRKPISDAYPGNIEQMGQATPVNYTGFLDAKTHPERYGDLIFRGGGFSIQSI